MNFKYIKRYGLLALAIAAIHILATNYSNRSVPEDSPQVVLKKMHPCILCGTKTTKQQYL